jgi:hypothetical protein
VTALQRGKEEGERELLCSASKRELETLRSQERPVGPAQVETSSLFYFLFYVLFSVFFSEI